MFFKNRIERTTIKRNDSTLGEPIENVVRRAMYSGEPIDHSSPMIYQTRAEGINPLFDIRSNRMELAAEATNAATKDILAKRATMSVVKDATDDNKSSPPQTEAK